MKNNKLKLTLLAMALFFLAVDSFASHLMGGSLNYNYVSFNSSTQTATYDIDITMYRRCDGGSAAFLPNVNLGAYIENTGNSNKTLFSSTNVQLGAISPVVLPSGGGCSFNPNVCVEKGVYSTTISLPFQAQGYYLIVDVCCRNLQILNIDAAGNNSGMSFYAYVPPAFVNNSSPVFVEAPVPYLCVSDTTSLLNSVIDPDGDLLTYSFVTPFEGLSNGVANPPNPNPYTFPIPLVTYNAGFNLVQPFGTGSLASINGATGLTQYSPPGIGFYVVAVEIKEFRGTNPNPIGITRRDLQIIVITCPPNNTPNQSIDIDSNSVITTYNIRAGQNICFDIGFTDPTDSLFLSASGDIFNGNVTNPPATFASDSGALAVSSQFCWNSSCAQAGSYQFFVKAYDNGCPRKTLNAVYTINVAPLVPSAISGAVSVCAKQSGVAYSVPNIVGSTFNWTISGGTIVSGNGTNAILVDWGAGPSGTVSYTETNDLNCVSPVVNFVVNVNVLPSATAGADRAICIGSSTQLGTASIAGFTYSWSPATALSSTTIANPNANPTVTSSYVVTMTNLSTSCVNKDTVQVLVNLLPVVNAGPDLDICIGGSTTIGGSPSGPAGSAFLWNTLTGLNDSTIANPNANPIVNSSYFVIVTDTNGCVNRDSMNLIVNPLPSANAGGPTATICLGDSTNIGSITLPNGSIYSWSPSLGLANSNSSLTAASPVTATNYILTVTDSNTCVNTDSILVNVNLVPSKNAGLDKAICFGQSVQIGDTATLGNTYLWTPATGLNSDIISNPIAAPTQTTTYILTEAILATGCFKTDTVVVTVNELPAAFVIADDTICFGSSINIGAPTTTNHSYSWSPSTGLNDSTISNPLASPLVQTTYTLIETNTVTGCADSNSVTISLNAIGNASVGTPQTICRNDSAQIGDAAIPGNAYSWSPVAGLSNSSSANPMASPAATTTYTLTETILATGCQNTNSVVVTVNQLPPANAGGDLFLCPSPGNSVQINATGGGTYSWSPNIQLSDPNIANPIATPDTTIDYIVVVTDSNGCQASDTVEVLVFPIVPVNAGFNRTICLKDSIAIGGIPTAPQGSTYLWTPSLGLDNATSANPKASPSVTTQYVVQVTNDTCRGTDTVIVFVNPIPSAVVGSNRNICINDSTVIGVVDVIGNTYSWISVPAGFTSNQSNPTVKPNVTTTYYLTETITATGCFKTDSITLTVQPLPIVSAGTDKIICIGSSVNIGGTPTGPLGSAFLWSPSTGLNNVSFANPSASPTSTSTYIVRVTDGNTCVNFDTVLVTVNPLPIVSAGSDLQLCINDTIAIGGSPTGPLNSTAVWTPASSLVNALVANPLALPVATTNYIVTVTDTNSCVNKDTMQVVVNVLPVVNAGLNRAICFGDSTLLGGLPFAVNSTFTWSPTAGLDTNTIPQPLASPASTVNYILTVVENTTTCVNRDTVTVTVIPLPLALTGPDVPICIGDSVQIGDAAVLSNTYLWSPSAGLNSANISNPIALPTQTTTYILKETNTLTGCFKIDSVVVTVNPLPLAVVGASQTICLLQTVNIGAPALAGNTYNWTPAAGLTNTSDANPGASPSSTTTYVLTETITATGCFKKDSVVVNVNPLPPANGGLDQVICFGKNVQIGDTAILGNTYLWTPSGSLNSDVISNPIANPTQTTSYTLTETITATGCTKQDTVTVIVNPLPIVVTSGNAGVCSSDSIQLFASGGSSYLWSPSNGLSSTTIPNPKSSPNDTITYTIIVTTALGCVDSTTLSLDVNPLPMASASVIYTPSCDGLKAAYTNTSTISNSESLNYIWDFGDNASSTEENTEHTYAYGQIYTTTLTAISQNNCKNQFSIVNDVQAQKDNVKINLSNVITPNADGVNDCFYYKADGKFDECSELWVYNRWGNEIFKSANSEACWDGRDKNGNVVDNGVYYFVYKIQDFKQNGSINVYR
jgi:gliding motility-associated-like protein